MIRVTHVNHPGISVTAGTQELAEQALHHRITQLSKVTVLCTCTACQGKTPVNQHDDDGSMH